MKKGSYTVKSWHQFYHCHSCIDASDCSLANTSSKQKLLRKEATLCQGELISNHSSFLPLVLLLQKTFSSPSLEI